MKTSRRMLLMHVALFIMSSMQAQSAINVKAGFIDRRFADETALLHSGQSIGLDAIVEDTRFLFMPGFHYQRYEIIGTETRGSLFHRQRSIHQISLPASIGTWVLADKLVKIRVYGGGHINFIVGVDANQTGVNLDRVKTVHPGWQLGGQLLVWRITADVRYYKDYRQVVKTRSNSIVRGWEFLIGFTF